MQFEIIRAVPEDAGRLNDIMEAVTAGMEKPEWFISDDLPYITEHIGSIPITKKDLGFVLKAVVKEEDSEHIAGFFMVDFPGVTGRNLGTYLNMSEQEQELVAHMDSVVILPQYRGHGLQYKLMEAAERIIREETDYRILLATVHPDNEYSLRNARAHGFRVAAEVTKCTYRRYVMRKEIS